MPYTDQHLYLTWGGTLGTNGGPEIWQTGVRIAAPLGETPPSVPDDSALTSLFTDTLAAFHSTPGMWISSHAWLGWVKAVHIATDGSYAGEPITHSATPVAGGSTVTTERSGMQDSTVVSLWSGLTLGQANHGRFYTPWANAQIDPNTGRVVSDVVATMLTAAVLLVRDINSWALALPDPGIVRIMSKVGSGTTKAANYVKIGDVRDTQRRRRDGIQEAYQQELL